MPAEQLLIGGQIRLLWAHLSPRRKKQLAALVVLIVVASFAEIVSIGAVLPFLGVLAAPEMVFAHEFAQTAIVILQIESTEDLLLFLTLIFMGAAILAGLVRIIVLWAQARLSTAIGEDFSVRVYERTLYQPYSTHVSRNSSDILTGIQKTTALIRTLIQPALLILSSTIILTAIVIILLIIHPFIALTAFVGFGFIYIAIISLSKRYIAKNSITIAFQQGRVTKAIQEGLGGIRDVLIDGTQPVYSKLYRDAFKPLQLASVSNQLVGGSPRFGVEALGMVLVAGLAYALVVASGPVAAASTLPTLGAFALGAQRLLPVLQQIFAAYIVIKGDQASTQDALNLLDQPMPKWTDIRPRLVSYETAIALEDLGFRYTPTGPWVLRHLNLRIPKGSRVGFVGVTGSGKSTLLDIIMGLLTPTEGRLLIDNLAINPDNTRAWQAHISHVPQAIYLSDDTIAANIAFGVPSEHIDLERVKNAAERSQIAKTIDGWPSGYDTLVGERGVRLSGGQRQRIGIARALYKQASVIMLDEATSALDSETELAVVQAMEALGREITLLIVAHRLTTLCNCDFVVEIIDGTVKLTEKNFFAAQNVTNN